MLAKGKGKGLGEKGSGGNGIITGGGSVGGSGPGGDVFTNTVLASGTGRLAEVPRNNSPYVAVSYPGSPLGMIPGRPDMHYQSNINSFLVDALEHGGQYSGLYRANHCYLRWYFDSAKRT